MIPSRLTSGVVWAIAALSTTACAGDAAPRSGTDEPVPFDVVFAEIRQVELRPTSSDPIGEVWSLVRWRENLVVLDPLQTNVKVFDDNGQLRQTIGQAGSGPGEFRYPYTAAALADGRLAVLDVASMTMSIFRPDGAYERGWLVPVASPGQITPINGGRLLLIPAVRTETRGERTVRHPDRKALHVFDLDGTLVRSYSAVPTQRQAEGSFFTLMGTAVGWTGVSVPMSRNTVRHVDLQTGREWEVPVGSTIYVPPAWPRARFPDLSGLDEWATRQMWTKGIVAIDSSHYVVKFVTYPGGKPLYHYAVAKSDGTTVAVCDPTSWDLHLVENGVGYATRTDEEGNVTVAMLRIQLPGAAVPRRRGQR
ncbi:MAG: 6-bladed beta-propeller [Longimicrobiaceae bacterium]